jgi:hypothetical protein
LDLTRSSRIRTAAPQREHSTNKNIKVLKTCYFPGAGLDLLYPDPQHCFFSCRMLIYFYYRMSWVLLYEGATKHVQVKKTKPFLLSSKIGPPPPHPHPSACWYTQGEARLREWGGRQPYSRSLCQLTDRGRRRMTTAKSRGLLYYYCSMVGGHA